VPLAPLKMMAGVVVVEGEDQKAHQAVEADHSSWGVAEEEGDHPSSVEEEAAGHPLQAVEHHSL